MINGEADGAEIYAVDPTNGAVIELLATRFGVSHVVGGGHHPTRDSFFLLQDNVPGAADENQIAEIDSTTGAVLGSFQTTGLFDIFYGALDVCASTGNLLVVSSNEGSIGEFTPTDSLVTTHALPAGVGSLSGIGVDDDTGEVWVSGTTGVVWQLSAVACSPVMAVPMVVYPGILAGALLVVGWYTSLRGTRAMGCAPVTIRTESTPAPLSESKTSEGLTVASVASRVAVSTARAATVGSDLGRSGRIAPRIEGSIVPS